MRLSLLASVVALGACVEHRGPITGTQSLQIDLVSPADPGSIDVRLPDGARAVTASVTALGPDGQIDATFHNTVQVYAQYLGTLTPYFGGAPLATVNMTAGKGMVSLMLPAAFGPTTLWFDDGADSDATYATGVSPTLWYRDPFIADLRTPISETGVGAFEVGPVDGKNVAVNASRFGARGRLVITSVYAQGYTLSDVQCADTSGTPPCTFQPQPSGVLGYDSIDIYSYSAPLDQQKRFLNEGQTTDGFAGGVSEFDGLLEIGFPQTFVGCNTGDANCPDVNKAREPAPVVFDATWFTTTILFKRNESNMIEVDNAIVCPLDSDYASYKQWKLDPSGVGGANCSGKNLINVISTGIALDPSTLVGKTIPRVVGNERSVNIASFHVWIIYPRGLSDFTLP